MTFDTTYDGNGRDTDDIARLLAGGKIRGRKRMRRLLIARLISDKRGAEADDEDEGIDEDEGGGEDQRLARLLVGGAVRKRRLRRWCSPRCSVNEATKTRARASKMRKATTRIIISPASWSAGPRASGVCVA